MALGRQAKPSHVYAARTFHDSSCIIQASRINESREADGTMPTRDGEACRRHGSENSMDLDSYWSEHS